MKHLLMFMFMGLLMSGVMGQTATTAVLSGKITDDQSQPLIGANIKVLKGADFIKGTVSDFNGEYRIQIEPGTYDIEFSYTGFSTSRQTGVQVLAGQVNTLNVTMSNAVLQEVVISAYKVPMIQQDYLSSGQTLTSNEIRNLPTRRINSTKASNAGTSSIDGSTVNIKGSRSDATNYYIDGVRVSGATESKPARDKSKSAAKPSPKTAKTERRKAQRTETDDISDKRAFRKEKAIDAKDKPAVVAKDSINPELYAGEQYNTIVENPFLQSKETPVSTFSIDVDAASYANIRRYITAGSLPPRDAVRIEEMINYL